MHFTVAGRYYLSRHDIIIQSRRALFAAADSSQFCLLSPLSASAAAGLVGNVLLTAIVYLQPPKGSPVDDAPHRGTVIRDSLAGLGAVLLLDDGPLKYCSWRPALRSVSLISDSVHWASLPAHRVGACSTWLILLYSLRQCLALSTSCLLAIK